MPASLSPKLGQSPQSLFSVKIHATDLALPISRHTFDV